MCACVHVYASTVFMIQGETLATSIAHCRDVNDFGGLSELVTTYVILSRVTAEAGLLLMQHSVKTCSQWEKYQGRGVYCNMRVNDFAEID